MSVAEYRIDPQFQSIFDQQSPEQESILEDKIKREGFLEPITVWDEKGILLDGHMRVRVCTRLGVTPTVQRMSFPNRNLARLWAIQHQRCRRSLSAEREKYFMGEAYNIMVAEGLVAAKRGESLVDVIAERYEVDPKTVQRNAAFAKQLDKVAEAAGQEVKQLVFEQKITPKQIKEVAKLDEERQREVVQAVAKGAEVEQVLEVAGKGDAWEPPTEEEKSLDREVEAEAARGPVDPLGTPIPESLRDAFASTFFQDSAQKLREFELQLRGVVNRWGKWYAKSGDTAMALRNIISWLEMAVPYAVHPRCQGKGCPLCRQTGYVPQNMVEGMKKNGEW